MEASYIVYLRRGDPASQACLPYCVPGLFYVQDVDELKQSLMAQGRSLPAFLKGIPTVCTNEATPKVWVGSNAQTLIRTVYEASQQQQSGGGQPATKRARAGGAPPRHVPANRAPRPETGSTAGRIPPHRVAAGAGNMPSGPATGGEGPTQVHDVDVPIAPPTGPAAAGCTVNDELFNVRFNRKDVGAAEDAGASLNDLMARYNQGR